jgi:hypothetical protein
VDDFARLPCSDRRVYFEQAAAQRGLIAQMIEKDFWVCWSLKRLFSLAEFQGHLTFKGGTSLSKVYHVIERFSEDVDVAIERAFLGFGGDKEPEKGHSGKEQQRRVERLKAECQSAVTDRLQPQLRKAITMALGSADGWTLSLDPADPDQQSLMFEYPPAIAGSLVPYFAAAVKIELGARSDHIPVEVHDVTPYVSDEFPDVFSQPQANVRVLAAARTFWEKATILHALHHASDDRKIQAGMSRHYYDVYRLAHSPIFQRALDSIELLERVAVYKSVFFKSAKAHYETARPGTLRLTPSSLIIGELKQDYLSMQPMFFANPPSFDTILSSLPEFENLINNTTR